MILSTTRHGGPAHPGMGFREFVAFIASLMAVNALGVDIMLPALPAMSAALGILVENQRQFIVAAYVFGFGVAQLAYGPLSDRLGRRPVLLVALGCFAVACLIATFATDFTGIIVARILQGVVAAASRVLAVSIVRDCYAGRQMARVMSLSFIVLLGVPILAPSIGQLILLVGPWPLIFYFLSTFGAAVAIWGLLRLPETLHAEYRRPISAGSILAASREVVTNRYALGYTLAQAMLYGALMGYINSVQQIFADIFHRPAIFPIVFACTVATMAVGSFFNSRIVERLGTRKVSHTALLAFVAVAGLHLAIAASGHETVPSFAILLAMTMGCFSLAAPNFGSMAMEPVGHIAGTASSIQGFISTTGGALVGVVIGQSFNVTTVPVAAGFFLMGLAALGVVFVVERGQLFRAHNAPVPVPA